MEKLKEFVLGIVSIVLIIVFIILGIVLGWFNTWFSNKVDYVNHKIEDRTSYETRKKVEDTCRNMIASYETDKSTYYMYKNSDNEEKRSWAEQAKTYNEYVLKNSYVFENNIPEDIKNKLNLIMEE